MWGGGVGGRNGYERIYGAVNVSHLREHNAKIVQVTKREQMLDNSLKRAVFETSIVLSLGDTMSVVVWQRTCALYEKNLNCGWMDGKLHRLFLFHQDVDLARFPLVLRWCVNLRIWGFWLTLWLRHTLLRTDRTIRQGLCYDVHRERRIFG